MVVRKIAKNKKNHKNKAVKPRKKFFSSKKANRKVKQKIKIKKKKLFKIAKVSKRKPLSKRKKIVKLIKKEIVKKNRKKNYKNFKIKKKPIVAKKPKPLKKIKLAKKNSIKPIKSDLKLKTDLPSPKNLFKAKIKVIGIGGGGGSIVSEIGSALNKATFMIADTDIRALKKKTGIKYFWFGEEFTHGLGTGVDPDLAKEAAKKEKEKIVELFKGQDIVIFIASLGGGLGSGATEIFTQVAKELNVITFGIFTLPFKFEGKKKERIAKNALKRIRESLNVSITIPNEKIFKVIDNNTPIIQAFSIVNKNLADSLESLIDLIYSPGLINIDFADVSTILRGRGNLAFLNSVESFGKDRAEDIIKKIIYNPLYQNNNFIAEKILFNISGDNSLSMFEVEKISKSISELNPGAKIIFGVSKNAKLKRKIKATLLMAGPSKEGGIANNLSDEKEDKKEQKKESQEKIVKNKKKEKLIPLKKEEQSPFIVPPVIPNFNKIPISESEFLNLEKESSVFASRQSKEDGAYFYEEKSPKKTIRRNALEIKKAEAIEENKKFLQEKEWEIPTFLRKIKPEH